MTRLTPKTFLLSVMMLLTVVSSAMAGNISDIKDALSHGSMSQVQEKIYVHTDNSCYFVGDTLWYKAYVVRADDLKPTDLSRILYVELLSPDGLVVERQRIVISANGLTCGQFVLEDSLYSGYYELRAYTRWNLNFNVRHHRYRREETWWFYNKQMAADYFRIWDGLYSRVLPIYAKPQTAGDFDERSMYQRPKTRVPKPKKDDLIVNFYPEGGHLIEGVKNRVAFEAVDQLGQAVTITGKLSDGGTNNQEISTEYMGRGVFEVTPQGKRLKAEFRWHDKNYDFSLPKAEKEGVAMSIDGSTVKLQWSGLNDAREYGLSVLCRGSLKHFEALPAMTGQGSATVELPIDSLPTGINDITVFSDEGQIMADRLLFVNHHEHDGNLITAPIGATTTYSPYQKIEVPIQCEGITEPTNISVSIRDTRTDEPSYDTDNVMTSMLLSSELRGFIAYPHKYFESNDQQHQRMLDLLMMVQGWRKYNWKELSDTARQMRYMPELRLTVEGNVYKMLSITPVESDEISSWQDGVGVIGTKIKSDQEENPFEDAAQSDDAGLLVSDPTADVTTNDNSSLVSSEYGSIGSANDMLGVNHGNLRQEVLVEAELSVGTQFVGAVQKTTDRGHFLFDIPPFYGGGYLNIKAYKESDSIKKAMSSRKDATILSEDAFPDYYVKQDLFYPIYTHPYNYYENHQPDVTIEEILDTVSELSMENDLHQLGNVNVKGRRRGRRSINWNKPAYVVNAYDIYNDMTDRGLSYGKVDMRQFPVQVCRLLYGNMNRYKTYNVEGRIEKATYYRNFSPVASNSDAEAAGIFRANRTSQYLYNMLKLRRLQDIRVFTDFEPRLEDSTMVESAIIADATVELIPIPDDGTQVTFRDRHLWFYGFNKADQFYQPDYSEAKPAEPTDYRRTLYWNPNAETDEEGRFTATFYNNSRETRIKMTAAGITHDGRLLHSK